MIKGIQANITKRTIVVINKNNGNKIEEAHENKNQFIRLSTFLLLSLYFLINSFIFFILK